MIPTGQCATLSWFVAHMLHLPAPVLDIGRRKREEDGGEEELCGSEMSHPYKNCSIHKKL
jgi:hypothetical protein